MPASEMLSRDGRLRAGLDPPSCMDTAFATGRAELRLPGRDS